MKKFELVKDQKIIWYGRTLFRIKACIDFETNSGVKVHAGDLGGYLEYEDNLSQEGKAWVFDNAKVCGNAYIHGNAYVHGDAVIGGDALIYENARVYGNVFVHGNAVICGNAEVCGNAVICEHAVIQGSAIINGNAVVNSYAYLFSTRHIFCITPIDECGKSITFFRTNEKKIKICYNFQTYTIEGFKNLISEWDKKKKEIVISATIFAQNFIDLSDKSKYFSDNPYNVEERK